MAMKAMPACFCLLAVSMCTQGAAASSAGELLDEAIWWPGDFAQMCMGDGTSGPFEAPNISAYGPLMPQFYFLSKDTIGRLKERRAEVSAELVARLKAFDWRHIPPPPRVSKRVNKLKTAGLSKADPHGPGPAPWAPPNSRALGGAMLRVIAAIDAVETLPELMRLEEQLNVLNTTALDARQRSAMDGKKDNPPDVFLPSIDTGGVSPTWDEWRDDWAALGHPGYQDKSPWRDWLDKLSRNQVFQRELLGVCLEMVDHADYPPLKTSLVGRLRNLGLQREGRRTMEWAHIQRKEDITAKNGEMRWDDALGVPVYPHKCVDIPGTAAVREDARAIIQAFLDKEKPAGVTDGAALLKEVLAQPGGFSQMCSSPPPIPFDVPLTPGDAIAPRYFFFSDARRLVLMAHRDLLIQPLTAALAAINLKSAGVPEAAAPDPMNSGQSRGKFGPLLLRTAGVLNAVEALPEVLRTEDDLHDLIIRTGRDPSFTPPLLDLNSPVEWTNSDRPEAARAALTGARNDPRSRALFSCRVYQRELLGLMFKMLHAEHFEPLKQSKVLAAFKAEGRRQLEVTLQTLKSEKELLSWQRRNPGIKKAAVSWDVVEGRTTFFKGAAVFGAIVYTEAERAEIRQLAQDFLKTVPPEKREAANGMEMSWLYDDKEEWLTDYSKS